MEQRAVSGRNPLPTAVTSRGQRRENGVSSLSPLC